MHLIPQHPIVDTGLLFDFLLWQFSDTFGMPTLLYKLTYLTNDFYRKSIRWYFAIAKPITTCPEVIAEIHGHAARIFRKPRLGDFWRFAQKELIELGLNEKMVKLTQMDSDTLSSFFPTDTALLHIARLSPNLNQPVLTEDGKLAGECRKKEVSVLRIADVRGIWQEYVGK